MYPEKWRSLGKGARLPVVFCDQTRSDESAGYFVMPVTNKTGALAAQPEGGRSLWVMPIPSHF
jgi:hypothetical protein